MSVRSLAKELGVSPTTVSLALKNSQRVSLLLRKKVRGLAMRRGYIPNARLSELMCEVRQSKDATYKETLGAFSQFPEEFPWDSYPHLRIIFNTVKDAVREYGYDLDYFWLKRPGLNPYRFQQIITARGIRGLVCLGSPNPGDHLPKTFNKFTLVSWGPSIADNVHRVVSDFIEDTRTLLNQLRARKYQRPGLILLKSSDIRTQFKYSDAFIGFQNRAFSPPHIPILCTETWDNTTFESWFSTEPDVLLLNQTPSYIQEVEAYLKGHGYKVPDDIGIALLDKNPNPPHYSGISQNNVLMASTLAELLMNRVQRHDSGFPHYAITESIVGEWNEGQTLRSLNCD